MPHSNLHLRFRPQERLPRQWPCAYTLHIQPCHRLIGHFGAFLYTACIFSPQTGLLTPTHFRPVLCLLHEIHTGGIVRVLRSFDY